MNALVTVRGEPEEKILHDALLAYFVQTGREMQSTHLDGGRHLDYSREETLPDRIRQHVMQKHIEPERQKGKSRVDIVVRDVHHELELTQKYSIVMGALDSDQFRRMAGVRKTKIITDTSGRKVVQCEL